MGLEEAFEKENIRTQEFLDGKPQETVNAEKGSLNETETKVEANTEVTKEHTTNVSQEEIQKQPENNTETQSQFDISSLNNVLGSEFNDINELKGLLSLKDKVSEYEAKIGDYETKNSELRSKYEDTKKYLNPRSYFPEGEVGDQMYRATQIMNKYPNINPNIAAKIDGLNLNDDSLVDIAVIGKQLDNPGFRGGDSTAKEIIAKQLNVDVEDLNDLNSLDDLAYNQLSEIANQYKQRFSEIKNIQEPETFDINTAKAKQEEIAKQNLEESKKTWSPVVKDILNGFKQLENKRKTKDGEVETYHTYEVDTKFIQNIESRLLDVVSNNGLKPDKDTITSVYREVENAYRLENFDKIMEDYATQKLNNYKKKTEDSIHNPQEKNTQEPTKRSDEKKYLSDKMVERMLGRI